MQTDVLSDTFPYHKGRKWVQVFRTTDKDARQQLIREIYEDGGYAATVDFPGSLFVEDMIALYPDAKVSQWFSQLGHSPQGARRIRDEGA